MYVQWQISIYTMYRHQHHQHDYKNNARKINLNVYNFQKQNIKELYIWHDEGELGLRPACIYLS
jgi:hypothetical protein